MTLVGVPGIGKSRLVAELLQIVEEMPELITWRQGRCLPYGEGISYWALGEMAKAQAGILESDPADEAARKLTEAVAALVPDPDRGRLGDGPSEPPRRARARTPARGARVVAKRSPPGGASSRRSGAAAHGARLRGPALGRRRAARVRRRPRRPGDRGAVARPLQRPAGAARATSRLGRRQGERGDAVAVGALRRGHRAPDRRASLAGGAAGGDAADVAATRRRQPALRRGVHPHAQGSWPAAARRRDLAPGRTEVDVPETVQGIIAARLDALAAGGEGGAAGGVRGREGVLARLGCGDRRHLGTGRPRSGCTRSSARSSCAATAERPWRERRSTRCGTCSSATSPTARSRARAAPTCTSGRRSGSSRSARTGREDRAEMLAHHYVAALELTRAAGGDTRRARGAGAAGAARGRESRLRAQRARVGGRVLSGRRSSSGPRDDPDYPRLLFELGERSSWLRAEGAPSCRRPPIGSSPPARSRPPPKPRRNLGDRLPVQRAAAGALAHSRARARARSRTSPRRASTACDSRSRRGVPPVLAERACLARGGQAHPRSHRGARHDRGDPHRRGSRSVSPVRHRAATPRPPSTCWRRAARASRCGRTRISSAARACNLASVAGHGRRPRPLGADSTVQGVELARRFGSRLEHVAPRRVLPSTTSSPGTGTRAIAGVTSYLEHRGTGQFMDTVAHHGACRHGRRTGRSS